MAHCSQPAGRFDDASTKAARVGSSRAGGEGGQAEQIEQHGRTKLLVYPDAPTGAAQVQGASAAWKRINSTAAA
ncbi:hypothetical protein IscW_ISCW005993 [Ixodes scapularis]|uniref:Uncharacterized protein n=1 Tax=Ixodes scapularis TaxID=6945 RepID=B7PLR9_IXOSC|nr:hypothetical protein IscW_ISCW005993 [Ixodes scapularis]|eukprot:XP_002434717.1 hypothetical protein IscW_ISCW005993 [Ixodes scapularis]